MSAWGKPGLHLWASRLTPFRVFAQFPQGEARFPPGGGHQYPGEGSFVPSEQLLKQISPGLGQSWKHQEWSQQGWRQYPPFPNIFLFPEAAIFPKGKIQILLPKYIRCWRRRWQMSCGWSHSAPSVPFPKVIQLIQCLTSPSKHLAVGKRLPDFHLVMENTGFSSNCARGAAPLQVRPGVRAPVHPPGLHHEGWSSAWHPLGLYLVLSPRNVYPQHIQDALSRQESVFESLSLNYPHIWGRYSLVEIVTFMIP